ncbi:sodium channel protein 60E [Caerostris extrusa]|uniref:Sodium channel protein 60E n=1 Tax=Caerostris extrusa TaxID=172846 RepID=A0AAV4VEL5_CAEEX|nr:sodium channel protein 60E [Caerostris extrusa]
MLSEWDSLMEIMVDFREPDLQPEKNYHAEYYIYVMEGEGDIELLLTETQKDYYRAMIKFSKRKPTIFIEAPSNIFFYLFYKISYSWWFKLLISICICANAVAVAVEFFDDPLLVKKFVKYVRMQLLVCFLWNSSLKYLDSDNFTSIIIGIYLN